MLSAAQCHLAGLLSIVMVNTSIMAWDLLLGHIGIHVINKIIIVDWFWICLHIHYDLKLCAYQPEFQ